MVVFEDFHDPRHLLFGPATKVPLFDRAAYFPFFLFLDESELVQNAQRYLIENSGLREGYLEIVLCKQSNRMYS